MVLEKKTFHLTLKHQDNRKVFNEVLIPESDDSSRIIFIKIFNFYYLKKLFLTCESQHGYGVSTAWKISFVNSCHQHHARQHWRFCSDQTKSFW